MLEVLQAFAPLPALSSQSYDGMMMHDGAVSSQSYDGMMMHNGAVSSQSYDGMMMHDGASLRFC